MKCNVVPCTTEDKPFIFISYAHCDAHLVFPVLEGVAANGYNIWFDQGIEVNTTWSDEIANAILASEIVVVFVTKGSMASNFVRSEVEFAMGKNVGVIPVYLEGMDVMPPSLSLVLHSTQGINSNDINTIVFNLSNWLKQNVKQEPQAVEPSIWLTQDLKQELQAVESSMFISQKPLTVVKNQEEPREEKVFSNVPEREDNYWRTSHYGNPKEFENYFFTKDDFGGNNDGERWKKPQPQYAGSAQTASHKPYAEKKIQSKARYAGGLHAVSNRPFMAKLLGIIFFINVTQILKTYSTWGMFQRHFVTALFTWGLLSVILYWYFFRRSTEQASFFDEMLPNPRMFRSLLYWSLLLGWLISALQPELLIVWLSYISRLLALVQINWDVTSHMSRVLPRIPHAIKGIAYGVSVVSGALLVVDAVVTAVMSRFTGRA